MTSCASTARVDRSARVVRVARIAGSRYLNRLSYLNRAHGDRLDKTRYSKLPPAQTHITDNNHTLTGDFHRTNTLLLQETHNRESGRSTKFVDLLALGREIGLELQYPPHAFEAHPRGDEGRDASQDLQVLLAVETYSDCRAGRDDRQDTRQPRDRRTFYLVTQKPSECRGCASGEECLLADGLLVNVLETIERHHGTELNARGLSLIVLSELDEWHDCPTGRRDLEATLAQAVLDGTTAEGLRLLLRRELLALLSA